jgi:N utilization substance protein A
MSRTSFVPCDRRVHLTIRSEIMTAKTRRKQDEVGPNSAGQSGDIQQTSNVADADSESVEELLEEGNSFEAGAVQGVEDAKTPDVSEVTTHEVPEDDVPAEYLDDDDKRVA